MSDRSYMSIGDVLTLLKEEFPDITISKIRFLESQGLLDPERTPSGYRKFYDSDVDRLRWILRQQKEHFLPLKVIKGRLDPGAESAAGEPVAGPGPGEDSGPGGSEPVSPRSISPRPVPPAPVAEEPDAGQPDAGQPDAGAGAPPVTRMTTSSHPSAGRPPWVPTLRSVPEPPAAEGLSAGTTGVSLTFEELLEATGLEEAAARDLERYGLLAGRPVARTMYYDEEALIVGRLAAEFARFGVEARHLRMYKTAAEREAGFFEQIVTPLLKQRNPRSRSEAVASVGQLAELGDRLRRSMLRMALRDLTGG